MQHHLVCVDCLERCESGEEVAAGWICDGCRESLEDENGSLIGVRGRPEVRERPEPLSFATVDTRLPTDFELIDLAPVVSKAGIWVALAADGRLLQIDSGAESITKVGVLAIPTEPHREPWSNRRLKPALHVSASGEFVAIANDYGTVGAVYDLRTSRRTLQLHGGDYHPETVPFSFTFLEHRGRTVAVHRTAWNRLDASDAATGELLTSRDPTSCSKGEDRPEHYHDYFHGRLLVSPDGGRILDDGWVWSPFGVPEVWGVRAWFDENVWESEDGTSKVLIAQRGYYWDQAMCWIDGDRLALGGIGDDDLEIIPGARIFSVENPKPRAHGPWLDAEELSAFAGPAGVFFSDGRRLFASDVEGLSVWDIEAGAMTGRVAGFRPTKQHPASRELVEHTGLTLRRWHY